MKKTITRIGLLGIFIIPQFADAQVSSLRQEKDLVFAKLLLPGKGTAECSLETTLDSTETLSVNVSQKSAGEFEVRKKVKRGNETCNIAETISTAPDGIKWTVEITGTGKSWSRPILTALKWRTPSGIDFWTTWSDNQLLKASEQWQDPFLSAPLSDMELKYGGTDHISRKAFVIPVATSFFNKKTSAASFLSSPRDSNLDMDLVTHANGSIAYRHSDHRINNRNKIRFTMYLTVHEADWRGGLAKYYKLYPEYFTVKEPLADEMAGCASYSAYEGELDAEKYKQMAYSINWKASLDFPYMSMFLPYTKTDEEKWTKMKQRGVTTGDGLCSIEQMRSYSERFRKMGFYTLSYFNVTEAGNQIKKEVPPRKASAFEDWHKDANDFVYYKMREAVITPPNLGQNCCKSEDPLHKFPLFSWEECVAMDPGESVFQRHILDQAKRHIEKIPASSGICIDRLDWLRCYNTTRDDSITFNNGQETASLLTSWKTLLEKLGPLMHQSHKVIFCNPLLRRIDIMEEMDGIYDEYGQFWHSLNLCSQMATHRPMIAWTASPKDFKPNPDFYFQTHLYMGAFLTAPIQGNDHTITPDEAIEKYYFDYGKMLMALRGRKWLLHPNAVKMQSENVKANIFETGGKVALIPIIHGKDNDLVKFTVSLPNDYLVKKTWKISVLYPDRNDWKVIGEVKPAKQLPLKINLMRGCAMVKIE